MGFRLKIRSAEDEDYRNYVGDDHKMYGYADFKTVFKSFMFLYPFLKQQNIFECSNDDFSAIDLYDLFCGMPCTDDIILSSSDYEKFADLYLSDLQDWFNGEDINHIRDYMNKMKTVPGNKILYWS